MLLSVKLITMSQPQKVMKNILLICAIFLMFSPAQWASPLAPTAQNPRSSGKLYKWIDDDGKIHFTDEISNIPAEYLDQVEAGSRQRTSGTPSQPTPAPSSESTPADERFISSLYAVGNRMFVDVELNGSVKARFLVDTGAAMTVISSELAQRLSLNPNNTWFVGIQGVSGSDWAFLSKVRSIAVGDATVSDLDVYVYDAGEDGILGMTFLGEFEFNINVAEKKLILAERNEAPGVLMYGGFPEHWWRSKFGLYRSVVESIKEYRSMARTYEEKEAELQASRSLRHFQSELNTLERKASAAAVPRDWRH